MRAARGLRVCLAAVVLTAVAAASVLDGQGADFVAGDDGDALVTRPPQAPALYATSARRPPDVCAARRAAPFLTADSPRVESGLVLFRLQTTSPDAPPAPAASEPLSSRAPPAA